MRGNYYCPRERKTKTEVCPDCGQTLVFEFCGTTTSLSSDEMGERSSDTWKKVSGCVCFEIAAKKEYEELRQLRNEQRNSGEFLWSCPNIGAEYFWKYDPTTKKCLTAGEFLQKMRELNDGKEYRLVLFKAVGEVFLVIRDGENFTVFPKYGKTSV